LEGAILGLICCSQFEQGISRKRVRKQMPEGNVNYQCPWISDFFLTKNRQLATQFLKTEYSVANSLGKKFRQKRQKTGFLWMMRHIYAYWLQFSEFLEINSPVKSKSA